MVHLRTLGVVAIVLVGLIGHADAQLFPIFGRAKNTDGCVTLANGKTVCPLAKAAAAVVAAPVQAVQNAREFRSNNSSARTQINYGSPSSSVGYGSLGSSVAGYGSSGSSVAGYGSSGTPYGNDYDGAPITGYGAIVSQPVTSGVCDCCCPYCKCNQPSEKSLAGSIGSRRDFRRELLSQAKQAQADGTISSDEYRGVERILRVPGVAMMLEAKARAGGNIDWATLLEKLLPIILELIKLFSASDVPTAMIAPQSIYISSPIASVIESFEPLPLTI